MRRLPSPQLRAARSCFLAACASLLCASTAQARDNFLIVLLDDVGVDRIGIYNDDVTYGHPGEGATSGPTPTIDALAGRGVLFRHAYSTPTCAPTRAQTLTGRHGFRTGIGVPGGATLDLAEFTLPELVDATHHTAAFGKWHLQSGSAPNDHGFDDYAGGINNLAGSGYFSFTKTTNGSTSTSNTYATTDEVDDAIAAIQGFGEDPWLVWLAFHAPHGPFHVPPSTLHTNGSLNDSSSNVDKYKAMLEAADTELNRLLLSIPQSILDDTTIFLIGDNGTPTNVTTAPFVSNHAKGTVYEGGVNVPFIVAGPHVPASSEGTESTALVATTDVFETVSQILGLNAYAEDSVTLLPYLQDSSTPTSSRRPYVYAEEFSPNGFSPTTHDRVVRDDTYKLIERDGVVSEMYNLINDPFEGTNLLPVGGLDPQELAAYNELVNALNTVQNGVPPLSAAVPALSIQSLALLAGLVLAFAFPALRHTAQAR